MCIDDIISMARSKAESIRHTQGAVDLLHSIGFGVRPDKIVAVPTRSLEFLGLQVNTARIEFRVPRIKIRDLRRQIHSTLSLDEGRQLTLRLFSSLIGKVNAVRGAVAAAPMHIWPLLHLQHSVLRRQAKWDDRMWLSTSRD